MKSNDIYGRVTSQYGNNRTIQKEVYDWIDSSNEDQWVLFMFPVQVSQLMKNLCKLNSRCQNIRDKCKMCVDETAYEMSISHGSRKNIKIVRVSTENITEE
jgi:hypothetical protein